MQDPVAQLYRWKLITDHPVPSVHVSPVCSQQPRDILQFVLACWRGWLRATCPVMQILRLSRLLTRVTSSGLPQPLFSSPLASAQLSCAAPQLLSSSVQLPATMRLLPCLLLLVPGVHMGLDILGRCGHLYFLSQGAGDTCDERHQCWMILGKEDSK